MNISDQIRGAMNTLNLKTAELKPIDIPMFPSLSHASRAAVDAVQETQYLLVLMIEEQEAQAAQIAQINARLDAMGAGQ